MDPAQGPGYPHIAVGIPAVQFVAVIEVEGDF